MPAGFWLAVASFAGLALAVLLAVYGCVAAVEARADEDSGWGRVLDGSASPCCTIGAKDPVGYLRERAEASALLDFGCFGAASSSLDWKEPSEAALRRPKAASRVRNR